MNIIYKDKALKKIDEIKKDLFDYSIQIFRMSIYNLTENIYNEINECTKIINNNLNEENEEIISKMKLKILNKNLMTLKK